MNNMKKKPFLELIRCLEKTLTKFVVVDDDRIPDEGALLLTTNHLSRLDTPLLMSITHRNDLVAIVAKKYQHNLILKFILEKIGTMVWMDRARLDFAAVREALNFLRHGAVVGIAPEGTRSRDSNGLLAGKQGAALIAARASVPIIPVGIIGSEKITSEWRHLRRPKVTVRVGEPYHLPEMDPDDRQGWLNQATDEIMCRIAALLPTAYRGVYVDYPRVKELIHDR